MKLANEIIKAAKAEKPRGYDIIATVKRIDDAAVWVHIAEGAVETPCVQTMDCRPGDKVRVHIQNGISWITGNLTAPATGRK